MLSSEEEKKIYKEEQIRERARREYKPPPKPIDPVWAPFWAFMLFLCLVVAIPATIITSLLQFLGIEEKTAQEYGAYIALAIAACVGFELFIQWAKERYKK